MKVTVITVCLNSEATIEDTIRSVINQEYANIEYLIVDGKSTDTTLEIINKYKDKISTLISEKDNGFYFAINKAIALAQGELICILNSDDFYTNSQVIKKVVELMEKDASDAVYGDLQYIDKTAVDKVIRNWKSGYYKAGLFLKGWMPPHPAFFVKKSCYLNYGNFNTDLKSAADYELMLRFIHKFKISISYLPEVLVKMRVGGKSNITLLNRIKANREDRLAWKINGLTPAPFTLILKPLLKLKQFLK